MDNECMHVKCKYVVIVMWNILQELNFTSTNYDVAKKKNEWRCEKSCVVVLFTKELCYSTNTTIKGVPIH
jgi:hypothetical protein